MTQRPALSSSERNGASHFAYTKSLIIPAPSTQMYLSHQLARGQGAVRTHREATLMKGTSYFLNLKAGCEGRASHKRFLLYYDRQGKLTTIGNGSGGCQGAEFREMVNTRGRRELFEEKETGYVFGGGYTLQLVKF